MADILIQKDASTLVPKLGISNEERAVWARDYTIYDINADGSKSAPIGPTSLQPADEPLAPDVSAQFRRTEAAALKDLVTGAGITDAQARAGIDLGDTAGTMRQLSDGSNLGARVRWYQPAGYSAPTWCWDVYPQSRYEG